VGEEVPAVTEVSPKVYAALHHAIGAGLIRAAHDLSEGGLAVAAAEMCIGGRLGMQIDTIWRQEPERFLFGETAGSLLLEVRQGHRDRLLQIFEGLPLTHIGSTIERRELKASLNGTLALALPVDELLRSWRTSP
jgi:phosphoribosylformylglycinamidine synthase